MSTWLTQRRFTLAPTRNVTSVRKARPTCVSNAAHSGSARRNVRSVYLPAAASHTTAVTDRIRLLSEPYVWPGIRDSPAAGTEVP